MELQEKYINLLTDFGFKRIFGTEENIELLKHFINLSLPAKHQVTLLTFRDKERIGDKAKERKAIYDIYCTAVNNEKIIVELQKTKQEYFKDRSIFYSSDAIRTQAPQGIWDFQLTPIYTISILNFVFEDEKFNENYIHKIQLRDENGAVFYDKLHYIYIELPKFDKKLDELETEMDKWLFIISKLHTLKTRPKILKNSIFDKIFHTAEIANYNKMERLQYKESLKIHRDLVNSLDYAEKRGEKRGEKIGEKRGEVKGDKNRLYLTIKNGLNSDFTLEQIATINGMTLQELEEIIKEENWTFE